MKFEVIDAPKELEELIIYEIATKNFTSPNGPETGTFSSLEEKIPYLQELGVNAIWLSGHQLCKPNNFYNIWSEYSCIRPDRLDKTLGTEEEFKNMIACAHRHKIKVFLDVITHGVMKDSPLVMEHPEWFLGESWGMADYDWYGGHKDLDEWWVNTWLWYIEEFGIDGYRLDIAHYRNDLWALIRMKAAKAGKQIITIAESGPATKGVIDILQHGEVISHNYGVNQSFRMLYDLAGYCKDRQIRAAERYDVKIFYEDGTVQDSRENTWYQENKALEVIWENQVTKVENCESTGCVYQIQMGILRVENIYGEKKILNIEVGDKQGQKWNSQIKGVLEVDYKVVYRKKRNGVIIEFPLRIQDGQFMSIQLSCHDNGWDGFSLEENPYGARGSRYLAGYTTLLAPGVPIFMSGEEFNADYRPLPQLSPKLFGGEMFGKGRWLYGSWIDWEQLKHTEKADMLEDMKRIIAIRKTYSSLVHPCKMGEQKLNFRTVDYECTLELPIPYYYQEEGRILIICANPNPDNDITISLDMKALLESGSSWKITSLFGILPTSDKEIFASAEELCKMSWFIRKDKTLQGGLLVLKFDKI